MMMASTARKKAQENLRTAATEELSKIDAAINEAIAKGEFQVALGGIISNNTKQVLEGLGYKIEEVRHNNEFGVFIKF